MYEERIHDLERTIDHLKGQLETLRAGKELEKEMFDAAQNEKMRQVRLSTLDMAKGDVTKAQEMLDFITEESE